MNEKININRILLGGTVAGLCMLVAGIIVHGVLLEDQYSTLRDAGIIRSSPNWPGMIVHHLSVIFAGIPLAVIYVLIRKTVGPGPGSAFRLGIMIGLICLPAAASMYAFYDIGKMIPVFSALTLMLQCVVGTLVAGALYKDNR
ncbi:MAG TPA: hypothetical protein EYN69_11955 [Flavobacteriales bacterium]|nr:hypothetical protein [Flavobacteriales bacterium]